MATTYPVITGIPEERVKLKAARTIYVRGVSGNDTTGSGLSQATAFKTVQAAINHVQRVYDTQLFTITLELDQTEGPYGPALVNQRLHGGGLLRIRGSAAGTAVTASAANCVSASGGALVRVENLTFTASAGGSHLAALDFGFITIGAGCVFGVADSFHINAGNVGTIQADFGYSITGGGVSHYHCEGGELLLNGIQVTIPSNITFSAYFIGVGGGGKCHCQGWSSTGAGVVTGSKYSVHYNGVIRSNVTKTYPNPIVFPGSTPGTVFRGGVFDDNGAPPQGLQTYLNNTANFQINIPAQARVGFITVYNAVGTAMTGPLRIGTTPGAADVVADVALGALAFVDLTLLKRVLHPFVDQLLYVSSTDWTGGNVIVHIEVQPLFAP